MENKKIVTMSFAVAALLAGLTMNILMNAASTSFGFFARIFANDLINHGLPVTVGLGTFLYMQFTQSVKTWAEDVVVEIKKVVWPTRKDTIATTVFVCVLVLIAGAFLAVFDVFTSYLVNRLLEL
jgi:preprotein translocase subunit SecE